MLLGTKRERTGDKKGANRGQKGSEPGTLLKCVSFLIKVGDSTVAVMRAEIGGGGTFGIDERFALAAWMSKPAPFFRV